jgi:hypothetical protein
MGKKGRRVILAMSKKVTPPPPPRLLELLDSRRPLMRPLVLALREQILREAPDAIEFVYSTYSAPRLSPRGYRAGAGSVGLRDTGRHSMRAAAQSAGR